jgi:hypothetical protein
LAETQRSSSLKLNRDNKDDSNRGPVSRDVEEDTTIKRRDLRNKTKVAVC